MALFAFDGTLQDAAKQKPEERTNVSRFCNMYQGPGEPYYLDGPGSRYGIFGYALGGFVGFGVQTRISEALADLGKAYTKGDHAIDIVGYSRGAAAAIIFAWQVHRKGIRQSRSGTTIRPKIRFLGLWDTVFYQMSTVGMPMSQGWKAAGPQTRFRKWIRNRLGGADLMLPPSVQQAFHALALHERRVEFSPARIDGAHEVWFAGEHADIGGQQGKEQLSETSLCWMLDNAQKCGVPVSSKKTPKLQPDDPELDNYFQWGKWQRDVRPGDLMHSSVRRFAIGAAEAISGLRVNSAANHGV